MSYAKPADAGLAEIPAHVPAELVVDYDRFRDPAQSRCPQRSIAEMFARLPPIFYTPRNGGHWMCARSSVAVDNHCREADDPAVYQSPP